MQPAPGAEKDPIPEKVSLKAAVARMTHAYEPEPVARVDDHQALVVRYEGDYPAHSHDRDEFLLCIEGTIIMKIDGREVTLGPQEGLRIPAGTTHAPRSDGATGLLFESASIHTRLPGKADD